MMIPLMDLFILMILCIPIVWLILKFVDKFSINNDSEAIERLAKFINVDKESNKKVSSKVISPELRSVDTPSK